MLGGNLGTLRGNYEEARQFLLRAIRHAWQRRDHYILARCLRKYGDFLRNRGHLELARDALLEALRLSGHGRGTRQRIYILGCLGDLERRKQNYAAASEHLERAVELARATFIPGWLGNLHLGLAAAGATDVFEVTPMSPKHSAHRQSENKPEEVRWILGNSYVRKWHALYT